MCDTVVQFLWGWVRGCALLCFSSLDGRLRRFDFLSLHARLGVMRCEVCGAETQAGARGRKPRFCSTRCRVAAHRQSNRDQVIPAELRERARWIRHSGKRPMSVDGRWVSVTDDSGWSSFDEALESSHGDGAGFVLNGDGIVCVDLDDVVEDGVVCDQAQALIDSLPETYVEVSPSGRGLHIWGLAKMSTGRRFVRDGMKVEVYPDGRYLTVTGVKLGLSHRRSKLAELDLCDLIPA